MVIKNWTYFISGSGRSIEALMVVEKTSYWQICGGREKNKFLFRRDLNQARRTGRCRWRSERHSQSRSLSQSQSLPHSLRVVMWRETSRCAAVQEWGFHEKAVETHKPCRKCSRSRRQAQVEFKKPVHKLYLQASSIFKSIDWLRCMSQITSSKGVVAVLRSCKIDWTF